MPLRGIAVFGHFVSLPKFVLSLALILTFSPWEKEQPLRDSDLADDYSANSATRHSKKATNNSPSPRGRGLG